MEVSYNYDLVDQSILERKSEIIVFDDGVNEQVIEFKVFRGYYYNREEVRTRLVLFNPQGGAVLGD